MNIRTTHLGHPIEVFNVIINVQHYGLVIVPTSSEDRAEMVADQAYSKYANVLSVDIERAWLDEWNDDMEWLQ